MAKMGKITISARTKVKDENGKEVWSDPREREEQFPVYDRNASDEENLANLNAKFDARDIFLRTFNSWKIEMQATLRRQIEQELAGNGEEEETGGERSKRNQLLGF